MNAQQRQLLQSIGISPDQIEAIQAQARAQQQGFPQQGMNNFGPSPQQYPTHQPVDPSQPINLTFNRDANGGINISGLENLQFIPMNNPIMMQDDGNGGMIKIPSSSRGVNGQSRPPELVYTRYLVVFRDGCKLGFVPERYIFAINGMQTSGFGSGPNNLLSFPRKPVRPIQCPRGMTPRGASYGGSTPSAPSAPELPKVVYRPTTETGYMTKLGWKKSLLGGDSWQRRYFTLSADSLTYSPKEFDDESQKKLIPLMKNCQVQVVNRHHNALSNRYENGGWGSDRPIGFDNCVELQCPNIGRDGRTFYLVCETPREAQRWCDAIQNNINALPDIPEDQATIPSYDPFSSGFMKNAFSALGGALNLLSRQNDIEDPYKVFDFIKCCLQSSLPDEEIAFELSKLFDKIEDELH